MKAIELKRISQGTVMPTFGVLLYGSLPFAVTLERPWKKNKKMESCIPLGNYLCKRVNSPRFGNTFEVTDVPDRSHILFHKGNISDDTHGCILVGEQFDYLNGERAVLSSSKGYGEFLHILADVDEFSFIVSDHYTGSLLR